MRTLGRAATLEHAMTTAILGTEDGVVRLHDGALEPLGLAGRRISAIHAWRAGDRLVILAGSYGDGMFRSDDGGAQWTPVADGLTAPAFRTIAPDPLEPGAILCGTEPARIFRSRDGGLTWHELSGVARLAGADAWFLPYSPRAGALRNIYAPPGTRRLLASVEVGGLLDSGDGGDTWTYLPVLGEADIHHIAGHPDDPDLLYVSLGWAPPPGEARAADAPPLGGLARSRDGGRTWRKFYRDYTRASIVPPARPDLLLAGPAQAVGAQGRIEVSADGGDSWRPANDGIESPMPDMVELFLAAPDGSIWAICSQGRLFRTEPGEWRWRSPLLANAHVRVKSAALLAEA
jgi:photosystem II stability/assembly factor-like uncharacterized protein